VIRIVHRGTVRHLRAIAHGEVVRHRNGLAVRDAEAVKMAGARCPGAHAGAGAGLRQVDRRQAAGVMTLAVARKVALVRAPAHLTRLRALADEAVDRPGVDEFTELPRLARNLRCRAGDVDEPSRLSRRPARSTRRASAGFGQAEATR